MEKNKLQVSDLANKITKAKIRVMYDLARQKENVISLTVGEPDFQTPQSIIDVSNEYFNRGMTKYTPNSGLDVLKDAVAEYYEPTLKRKIDPETQVMITVGAQEALTVLMQILLDPGDEIMICTPHYPPYVNQAYVAHATPVLVPTKEENGWEPDIGTLKSKITERTKALILNSPCNPTGGELSEQALREIAEVCREHRIVVISDEPYNKIRYTEEPFVSIASLSGMEELAVVVNSFSKTYAMPGWRLGYAIGPEWIISAMPKTHDVMVSCVPAPFQYAGAYALKNCDADVEEMRQKYQRRMEIVHNGINSIDGLNCIRPKGTFYMFFNIRGLGVTSEQFAFDFLDKENVAVVPGDGFGEAGEGYIRLTFATNEETLEESMERLARYVRTIR